jgi:hypothetical protein
MDMDSEKKMRLRAGDENPALSLCLINVHYGKESKILGKIWVISSIDI